MKIIPAVDLMEGKVVRLFKGKPEEKTIYNDDPIKIAKKWEIDGADLIHLVDLDATLGRGSNWELCKKIVKEVSIPVQVAGGLRNESTITEALNIASKVVVGTLAFKSKRILQKLLSNFGNDRIVISVDHVDGNIVVNGWQKNTGINLIEGINDFLEIGVSEFLLTNVNRDGTLQGPDLDFLQKACNIKNTKIIASGGISKLDDIIQVKNCNAYGIILGKALYENKISIKEAKKIA
ncbi:MAG: 1-(5-phosphoribosyl)-5-[(5-phosphoribosylamino)methylideneamino]imidazole-4-carboxamide isomerase [Nitrosopumilaceae archaeon]|nr:1-(5-phosphoribosyl)-5-[(5-phosphoribosylamino)methylideneamino]imidazole-4-carboxamide isomerase [Nitrosopumilaceae archaeon]